MEGQYLSPGTVTNNTILSTWSLCQNLYTPNNHYYPSKGAKSTLNNVVLWFMSATSCSSKGRGCNCSCNKLLIKVGKGHANYSIPLKQVGIAVLHVFIIKQMEQI